MIVIFGQVAGKSVENADEFFVALVKRRVTFRVPSIRTLADGCHFDLRPLRNIHSLRKDDRSVSVFASIRHNERLTAPIASFKRPNKTDVSVAAFVFFRSLPLIARIREIRVTCRAVVRRLPDVSGSVVSAKEIETFRVISGRISCSTSVKGQTN